MTKDQEPGHSVEYRDNLTRLPQLANTMIHTNIRDEIEKLRNTAAWQQSAGRSSETLVKYADLRIVLVLMKQGSHMNDHHADGPISVHCLQGKIRLHLPNGQGVELIPEGILALDRGMKHDVEALEESAFLITISWPKGESSVDCQESK